MTSIKEITAKLKEVTTLEPWIEALAADERAGVQKALATFHNRLQKQQQQLDAHMEKVAFDESYLQGGTYVAGVDEAGRGPLAGPVVTAAAILPLHCDALIGINDSKQLSKEKRAAYAAIIKEHAICYSVHFQSVEAIDTLNIYEATRQSMKAAVETLDVKPDAVLADAMTLDIPHRQANIIKGDALSLSIAAASILAKTARDDYMDALHEQFPQYGFCNHAGYGTKEHLAAIDAHGITIHHRRSFEPIKSLVK
ncbi:ribonuclease HII [Caryophanon latum]|uniref:Ribonuclease HII n=1 Tax=Caryophanon latum TaxID=33977 RepID=A0A1C0YWI8_9BACL|nr:ribonuclease HII [Caryophanon latum]OCS91484.1 ribonuclease HII [Caryophanon latum]